MRDSARSHRKVPIGLTLACLVCSVYGWYLLPQNAVAQLADIVTYTPPKRGAPGGREGAGTRGLQTLPILAVLTPKDHTGLTVQEQPVLYWYLSQETQHPVDLILTDRQSVKPLLETRLHPPLQPGIQLVRLADYNIRLAPGVAYKWSVSLVTDPTQHSRDIVTAGTIERIDLPDKLRSQLVQADKRTSARLYAMAGLWYDTIATLSELIDAVPQDALLRQQRATLLDQEGLTEAAAYDRQRK
jgi:Domain of Unknown Function (DUF928)